jgi:hypothetical protein
MGTEKGYKYGYEENMRAQVRVVTALLLCC